MNKARFIRQVILLASFLLCAGAGFAETVAYSVHGTMSNGSSFSGSFSYDTGIAPFWEGANVAMFNLKSWNIQFTGGGMDGISLTTWADQSNSFQQGSSDHHAFVELKSQGSDYFYLIMRFDGTFSQMSVSAPLGPVRDAYLAAAFSAASTSFYAEQVCVGTSGCTVPEPGSFLLLVTGLTGAIGVLRRNKRA